MFYQKFQLIRICRIQKYKDDPATNAVDSGYFGYSDFISECDLTDFSYEIWLPLFCTGIKLRLFDEL